MELLVRITKKVIIVKRNATIGGFKKRSLKIDKPLALTILDSKVRCTKDTIVMYRTHDMRFGNFADTIKESYSEKLTKGS